MLLISRTSIAPRTNQRRLIAHSGTDGSRLHQPARLPSHRLFPLVIRCQQSRVQQNQPEDGGSKKDELESFSESVISSGHFLGVSRSAARPPPGAGTSVKINLRRIARPESLPQSTISAARITNAAIVLCWPGHVDAPIRQSPKLAPPLITPPAARCLRIAASRFLPFVNCSIVSRRRAVAMNAEATATAADRQTGSVQHHPYTSPCSSLAIAYFLADFLGLWSV